MVKSYWLIPFLTGNRSTKEMVLRFPFVSGSHNAAFRQIFQLYTSLAKSIWNPAVIKELAGGWDDAMEITVQSGNARRFTVEYGSGRSWADARKFGFVSAYGDSGTLLNNINVTVRPPGRDNPAPEGTE